MKTKKTKFTKEAKLNALMRYIKAELLPKRDKLLVQAGRALYDTLFDLTPENIMVGYREHPEFFANMVIEDVSIRLGHYICKFNQQIDSNLNEELSVREIFKDTVPFPLALPVYHRLILRPIWENIPEVADDDEQTPTGKIWNPLRDGIMEQYPTMKGKQTIFEFRVESKFNELLIWYSHMSDFLSATLEWLPSVTTVEDAVMQWPDFEKYVVIPCRTKADLTVPFTRIQSLLETFK